MLVAALVMLVVGGAADMASSAFRNAMIMTAATDEVRGRLQGVFIVVVAGGPRIADIVHGAAAAVVGAGAAAAGRRRAGDRGHGGRRRWLVPSFVRYRHHAVGSAEGWLTAARAAGRLRDARGGARYRPQRPRSSGRHVGQNEAAGEWNWRSS